VVMMMMMMARWDDENDFTTNKFLNVLMAFSES